MSDATEDSLRDAAHDAFMALWRGETVEQAALWASYCAAPGAQVYLMEGVTRALATRGAFRTISRQGHSAAEPHIAGSASVGADGSSAHC